MDKGNTRLPMPKYRSHKLVSAARIIFITEPLVVGGEATASVAALKLDGDNEALVPLEWMARHMPQVGGYLVQYADGYLSYSPAPQFEGGYTRLVAEDVRATQPARDPGKSVAFAASRIAIAATVMSGMNANPVWNAVGADKMAEHALTQADALILASEARKS